MGEGAQSPPPRQQPIIDPRTDWGVGQGGQQQRGQQRRDQGAASDRATPRASSAEEQPGGQLQAAQHTEALPAGGFRGSLSDTSHVHLFVAVVSLAANRLKRDAARSTWGTDPRCSPHHSPCYADFISSHMYMMCLQFQVWQHHRMHDRCTMHRLRSTHCRYRVILYETLLCMNVTALIAGNRAHVHAAMPVRGPWVSVCPAAVMECAPHRCEVPG